AAGFGVLWTIIAVAMAGSMPDEGPFAVAKYVFPAFGVLFILAALLGGRAHKPPQATGESQGKSAPPETKPTQSADASPQREMKLACSRCGATPANPSVSPHGDVKCEYCGTWYNVYRRGD
ncbi:MAG: hypothetical protein RDV41_13425, partial [Planctomycetota bacterium]|nr:hypothetical protein [Planctomycetota bacterium]